MLTLAGSALTGATLAGAAPVTALAADHHPGDLEIVNKILKINDSENQRLADAGWRIGRPETWVDPHPGYPYEPGQPPDGPAWTDGRLTRLSLPQCGLTGELDLTGLDALETLEVNDNGPGLKYLKGLETLGALKHLDAGYNQIEQAFDFSGLPGLETIKMPANRITGAAGLGSLKKLVYLNLGYNELAEVDDLGGLTRLTHLDLTCGMGESGDCLGRVGDLGGLTRLRTLRLGHNRLTDVGDLSRLGRLETLDLSGNRLTDIGDLSLLPFLEHLSVSGNDLTDIGSLKFARGLRSLGLARTRLPRLWSFAKLEELSDLNIAGTPFESYDFMDTAHLGRLESFGFSGRQFPDFSLAGGYMPHLTRLKIDKPGELRSLDLGGRWLESLTLAGCPEAGKISNPGYIHELHLDRDYGCSMAELRALFDRLPQIKYRRVRLQRTSLGDAAAGLRAGTAYAPEELSPALAAELEAAGEGARLLTAPVEDGPARPEAGADGTADFYGGRLTFPAPGRYRLFVEAAPDPHLRRGVAVSYDDVFKVGAQ